MTPNYDKIRVAFATGNPVAARDDLIAAIQEAVEHSHHSGEAVRSPATALARQLC